MIDTLEKNQKYIPDYGYTSPKKTKEKCNSPAFMDKHLHRVGYFKRAYDTDGIAGWICDCKCVNCGKVFKHDGIFVVDKKEKE